MPITALPMRDAYRGGGTGAGGRPFPFARTLTNGNGRKEIFFYFSVPSTTERDLFKVKRI